MNDIQKTSIFLGVAIMFGALALFTGSPSQPTLAQFSDKGEPFYPQFTDPAAAASLEVIDYDEESGTATPFKVQVRDGRWTIPSHYNYPADGEDRLATTAASVIDLVKDVVQSDRLQDHEQLGVIDPLDETISTLKGRGKRVALRDEAGTILAEFIIGREVEGRAGFRYVRIPQKKRTYAVKMEIDISTRFADWIETNLLDVQSFDINSVQIQDYSIDESTGRVISQGAISLEKTNSEWSLSDLPPEKELDTGKINTMTRALAGITITGVRPKPAGLTSDLRTEDNLTLDLPAQLSLQSKGYFISQDGRLLSNEGEVSIGTASGVRYTLRFGEILVGKGMEVSAGTETDATDEAADDEATDIEATDSGEGTENRYLFVTAEFDETLLGAKPLAPVMPETPTIPEEKIDASESNASTEDPETQAPPEVNPEVNPEGEPEGEPEANPGGNPGESTGGDPGGTQESEGDPITEGDPGGDPDNTETEIADAAGQDPPPDSPPDPPPTTAPDPEAMTAYEAALEQYVKDLQTWNEQVDDGRELATGLNDRFAPWYYVISAADFQNIRLSRDDLVIDKPAEDGD